MGAPLPRSRRIPFARRRFPAREKYFERYQSRLGGEKNRWL